MNGSTRSSAADGPAALQTALEAYSGEGGHVPPADVDPAAEEISFDGRQYRYETYRYDRREDAVAYAELMRERRAATVAVAKPSRHSEQ